MCFRNIPLTVSTTGFLKSVCKSDCSQDWNQTLYLSSDSSAEIWVLTILRYLALAEKSTSYSFKFEIRSSNCESFDSCIVLLFFIFDRFLLTRQSRDIRRTRIAAVVTCWTFLKSDVAKHFSVKTYSTVLYSIFNVVQRLFLLSLCEWSR